MDREPKQPSATGAPSGRAGMRPARLKAVSPAPLYAKVKHGILEAVRCGHWRPHQRIPSENELVRRYGVSRMTVNRALRELSQEGWLRRVQGVGTFVADTRAQSALVEVRDIAEEIEVRGHRHSADVLILGEQPAAAAVAEALGVREGTRVFHSLLVHRDNDLPVQLEERFVRPDAAPAYLAQDFTRTTPHAYLMEAAPLSEAEHVIEAVMADEREAHLLELNKPEPCLLLHRWTWSNGRTVSFAHLLFPGSRYRLGEHFVAHESGP